MILNKYSFIFISAFTVSTLISQSEDSVTLSIRTTIHIDKDNLDPLIQTIQNDSINFSKKYLNQEGIIFVETEIYREDEL